MLIKKINNHAELKHQLDLLIVERDVCEKKIFDNAKELIDMVTHPVGFIKQSAHELASSKDFRKDVFKIGVNFASNYLTRKTTNSFLGSAVSSLYKRFSGKNSNGSTPRLFKFISKIIPSLKLEPVH